MTPVFIDTASTRACGLGGFLCSTTCSRLALGAFGNNMLTSLLTEATIDDGSLDRGPPELESSEAFFKAQ